MIISIRRTSEVKTNIVAFISMLYLSNSFYFNGSITVQRFAVWIITFGYLLVNNKYIFQMIYLDNKQKPVQYSLFLLAIFIVFVFIAPIFHGTFDFSYISTLMKLVSGIVYALVPAVAIYKDRRINNKLESYVATFCICIGLYVLGTVTILLFPSLRTLIQKIVYISPRDQKLIFFSYYSTRFGWAGFSGFTTAIKCVICVIFSCFLILIHIDTNRSFFSCIVWMLLGIVGCLFYARTGVIVSIVCIFIFLSAVFSNFKRATRFFKYLVALLVIGFVLSPYIFAKLENNSAASWVFELFLNYESGNGLVTDSSSTLLDMYKTKLSISTFFFGDGYYTDPITNGYYKRVDIGFMRMILYFGIFGLFAEYYCCIKTAFGIKKIDCCKAVKTLVTMVIVGLLFFELKGEAWVTFYPYIFSLLLLVLN